MIRLGWETPRQELQRAVGDRMEGPKVAIRGLNAVAALLAAKEAFLKKTPITEATAMRTEAFY